MGASLCPSSPPIISYLLPPHPILLDYLYLLDSMVCLGCPAAIPDGGPHRCPACLRSKRSADRRRHKLNRRARNPPKVGPPKLPGTESSRSNARVRAYVDSLKVSPCVDCNRSFPPVCMDFDHRPGEEKVRDVSKCKTVAQAADEISKCDLVCANCHRLRTAARAAGPLPVAL